MVLLIILFIAIVLFEVPKLVKQRMWGELIAFSIFMIIGMFLSISISLDMRIINPAKGMEAVFSPISNMIREK